LYGCEILSLTLREKHILKVSENRALRRIFGTKREEWQEGGEDCIMRSLVTCTLHQMLLGGSNQGVLAGRVM
jgi:hypothetical protein